MNRAHLPLALVAVCGSLAIACGGAARAPSAPSETSASPVAKPADGPATDGTKAPALADAAPEAATPKSSAPTPAPEPEITSVRVYVSNECASKVEYCVEDGSTLHTSLTQHTSTTHTVKPGAKLRAKKGGSCGDVAFTAPASKDEVKFSICKR